MPENDTDPDKATVNANASVNANAKATEAAPAKPVKQENALLNILLNVLLPVLILSKCSKPDHWYSLGPKWALVVASALPLAYFLWDYRQRRKVNVISIIGLVSVVLTGGLGLLEMTAQAFAVKEASIPLALAAAFIITHYMKKPLVVAFLMNPDIMDAKRINNAIAAKKQEAGLDKLLWQSTWILAGSFLLSAVLNYLLAMYFLQGKAPGTAEYNQGIASQQGWGYLVIGVPSILFMVVAFIRMQKGLSRLTGLPTEQLLLPR